MERSMRWRIGAGAAAVLVGGAVVGALVTQSAAPSVVATPVVESTPSQILVDVQGAVATPGVYVLVDGARVVDAIARAGGASPDADTTTLNLAQPVADGAQVRVPTVAETQAEAEAPAGDQADPGAADGGAGAPGLVSINAADVVELDTLPRIGPALAGAIVAYRDEHGPFGSVAELEDVPGIGPAVLAQLEPLVTL